MHEFAGIIFVSEQGDRYPAFAEVHRDAIMRVPKAALDAIALWLKPSWNALAEGIAGLTGWSRSSSPKP